MDRSMMTIPKRKKIILTRQNRQHSQDGFYRKDEGLGRKETGLARVNSTEPKKEHVHLENQLSRAEV
jgi:hypothetical protein